MGTHTDLMGFSGGFIGVDVFFVLSGFLITTLLLEEFEAIGSVSLGRFYVRRALRLFPALLGVLITITLFALIIAGPEKRSDLLEEVAFAATYTTNFGWIHGLEDIWIGHTWSLALEEQFYLVWPPVLILCLRTRGERLVFIVATVAVAATIVWRLGQLPEHYGLLGQRPDALFVGCACACIRRMLPPAIFPARTAAVLAGGSLAVLVVGNANDDLITSWRGLGLSVVAVAAAMLILGLVADPTSKIAVLLSSRPLREVGVRSYGIYLWHLPVFRWTAEQDFEVPDPVAVGFKYSVALALAWASYALIERPALRLKARWHAPGQQREAPTEPMSAPTLGRQPAARSGKTHDLAVESIAAHEGLHVVATRKLDETDG